MREGERERKEEGKREREGVREREQYEENGEDVEKKGNEKPIAVIILSDRLPRSFYRRSGVPLAWPSSVVRRSDNENRHNVSQLSALILPDKTDEVRWISNGDAQKRPGEALR